MRTPHRRRRSVTSPARFFQQRHSPRAILVARLFDKAERLLNSWRSENVSAARSEARKEYNNHATPWCFPCLSGGTHPVWTSWNPGAAPHEEYKEEVWTRRRPRWKGETKEDLLAQRGILLRAIFDLHALPLRSVLSWGDAARTETQHGEVRKTSETDIPHLVPASIHIKQMIRHQRGRQLSDAIQECPPSRIFFAALFDGTRASTKRSSPFTRYNNTAVVKKYRTNR